MVIPFHAMQLSVRIKTFSTHVVAKIERNVSRKRFSTHEKHGEHGSHGLGVALVSSGASSSEGSSGHLAGGGHARFSEALTINEL